MFNQTQFIEALKANLVLEHGEDDELLGELILSALDYATSYQHHPQGHYDNYPLSESTYRAVIMLATHFYESRDGSTGGFFADNTHAAARVWEAVNRLLILDRDWKV
ncbi:MAG: head-tail connector protein [Corynebacterium sp.]|nr:head-tail connector protein [Corynebacterium sp.]